MRQLRKSVTIFLLTAGMVASLPRPVLAAGNGDDKGYRAGIGLLNKGLHDLAAAELRGYLRDNPSGDDVANARYSLAVCLVKLAKHAEAATELDQVMAIKGFEFAPDAMLLRAQCSVAAGDDAGALPVLSALVADHPKFGQVDRASAMLGESQYRLGKYDAAVATLGGVVEKWPASPAAERAGLLAAMGEMALRKHEAAATRAAGLLAKSPAGEYAANLALVEAQCRHHLGDLAAAMKLYTLAGKSAVAAVRAEGMLGLATVLRSQGDLAGADRAMTEMGTVASGELTERVTVERGRLLLDQGKGDAAAKEFGKVKASGPMGAQAAYWSAKCESAAGRHAEAAERLAKAAARFSKSELVPDMLFDRACALSKAGNEAGALEGWEQWRERFGTTSLAADAMLAEAWCAHRLGKVDVASELCGTLKTKFPKQASAETATLLVAENEYAAGRYEAALAAYGEFVGTHAGSVHAWRGEVRRGLCLLKVGKEAEGEAALESALAKKGEQDASLRGGAIMALGDRFFAKKDWLKAETWFARGVAEKSGGKAGGEAMLDGLLRQGICVVRQGRCADAIAILERVTAEGRGTAQAVHARFEAGQCLLELGRLDEAKGAMEEVLAAKKDPADLKPHAQRHLATIATRQGRPEDAAKILASVVARSGKGGETAIELGAAWLSAGRYAQAEKVLAAYVAEQKDGRAKGVIGARVSLAIAINRQGKHADALKQLDAAGDLSSLDGETRVGAMYERALALRSLDRGAEAAEAYRAVLGEASLGGGRLEAYAAMDLAQIESRAERHEEALKLVTRGLSAAERLDAGAVLKERGTYLRAACLLRLSKAAEAAAELEDFAKTYPKSAMLAAASVLRGEALLASGQPNEAATEFERAISAASTEVSAAGATGEMVATAMLRRGEALAAAQDWAACERAYASYLDKFAKSELWFQARFGQGWARENQGKLDAAIEAYRDVVARHKGPTAARSQFQIGECLYAQKKYEQASVELLKTDVLFEYPEWSAAAIYEAGRCLAEMGRGEDASKQFKDVVKRFPETRWAGMAKERLEAKAPAAVPGR
jgi:TolA-binding protein